MTIVQTSAYTPSYIIYNAPVNEKTKKLREMFKVDDVTGYPEWYHWRAMSRLGQTYNPEDPFYKFNPYDPNEFVSQKVFFVFAAGTLTAGVHYLWNSYNRRPWWSKPYFFPISFAFLTYASMWVQEKTLERQGIKNAIAIDYLKKHPERFGPIYRPKYREILFPYIPVR